LGKINTTPHYETECHPRGITFCSFIISCCIWSRITSYWNKNQNELYRKHWKINTDLFQL